MSRNVLKGNFFITSHKDRKGNKAMGKTKDGFVRIRGTFRAETISFEIYRDTFTPRLGLGAAFHSV